MAIRIALLLILLISGQMAMCQQSQITLYDFSMKGSTPMIEHPTLLKDSVPASGTPSFSPTDPVLYFSTGEESKSALQSFNYSTHEQKTIAQSTSLLLDPQITPDGKYVSCLRRDKVRGHFQLVKFPVGGGAELMLDDSENFDEHLWIDENAMLAVAAGDPNTLLLMTMKPKRKVAVANHVGASLQRSKEYFAFVHKLSVDSWSIKRIKPDGSIDILAETLPDTEIFTLTPDGRVLAVSENKIHWRVSAIEWKEIPIQLPEKMKIRNLGLNSRGDKLFVLFSN